MPQPQVQMPPNLFPEQVIHIGRSIELILGPIIGGIGTLLCWEKGGTQ
jgi:hypothetical protein